MSWDVLLIHSRQKIETIEELDDTQLIPTDFLAAFDTHFKQIRSDGTFREIQGLDFTIGYYVEEDTTSPKMVSLYGEAALYALIELARKHQWQIFDTGSGGMIDIENPSNNGYKKFQLYLQQIQGRNAE